MKRPLSLLSVALIAGIVVAYLSNSFLIAAASIAVLSFIFILASSRHATAANVMIGALIFYSLGAFEYLYINNSNEEKFKEFSGCQVTISGYIITEPDIRDSRVSYIIKTVSIKTDHKEKKVSGKVLLNTLNSPENKLLDYGRQIEVSGRLNMPKGKRNPGGFDYRKYLAQSGVSATIYATGNNIKEGSGKHISRFAMVGMALRNRIIGTIEKSLPPQQAGLLNGMLIGYRGGLDKTVQGAFSDAGLTHIMAVSGANVAFIVMPLLFVFKRLGMRQRMANSIVIAVLVIFVYVTGFSPSVLRAVIMAVTVLVGQILRRDSDIFTGISLAAILLLLYNPNTLFDIGFQLSFGATLSLVLFNKGIKAKIDRLHLPNFISDVLSATLAAQIGVLPITVYYFNKISLISLLTNILVVPITEIITILGFAMAALGQINIVCSKLLGYVNTVFLSFILYVCQLSTQLPFATIRVVTPPLPLIVLYYLFLLYIFKFREWFKLNLKFKHYLAAFGCILAVCLIFISLPGKLEVVFIDVGQGDSAFIKTSGGATVLIDGGGSSSKPGSNESNIGETTIIPFLLDYGVTKLDAVVASHGHDDHIQGLIPVLKEFNVDNLIIPDCPDKKELGLLVSISKARGINVEACDKGDEIWLDKNTYFSTLHPDKNISITESALNNLSLVLKLNYGNTSILFTGDIEKEAEELLVESKADVTADVLKVAHHGSDTSTTEEFLEVVKPKAAVISVGKNNFGHPSERVLEELENNGVKIFRTDERGAIILKSDGKSIDIKGFIKVKE